MENFQQQQVYSNKILNGIAILCIILFLFSYLSHLGVIPLDVRTDEARRALVSLEMMLSGDYVTPTINGELYFNKPPLYNWIVAASLKAGGSFDMFWFRLPVVISIGIYGLLIYHFVNRYCNRMIAMVAALAFITNGRIIIYDAFLGLIDLTFDFCMYWLMMLVFHYGEQKKYWQLFIYTYLLAVAGYLMKGMPALVFEALTLLTYFVYSKRFRVLFSIPHIIGIILLFTLLGSYYLVYFSNNHLDPEILFTRILTESTDRTLIKFGLWQTILHILFFPFTMIYHYGPWIGFILVLIKKDLFKIINSDPFIKFNWWVFLVNFLVYWTSPQVNPRYIFPLLPQLFTVIIYLFYTHTKSTNWQRKWPELFFGWLLLAASAGALMVVPFTGATNKVSHEWLKAFGCAAAIGIVTWLYFRQPVYRLLTLAIGLFVLRVAFNWFVIDQRGAFLRHMEATAVKIYDATKGKPLYLEKGADPGYFDGMSYHLSVRTGKILTYAPADTVSYFITDSLHLSGREYISVIDNPFAAYDDRSTLMNPLKVDIKSGHQLWLVKYKRIK